MDLLPHRPDGTPATDVAPYRRFMPALMTSRNGSVVFFDQEVRLDRTLTFLDSVRAERPDLDPSLFHVVLWALARTFETRPRLNRFVAGGRVYQRDGIWISYSIKRALSDEAGLEVVKRRFDPAADFAALVASVDDEITGVRAESATLEDKEVDLLLRLRPWARRWLVTAANGLDALNLLPRAFIESDGFFASAFVANLGSLDLDAAFHHLYEYGNIPIFCAIGRIHDAAVIDDGEVVVRPVASLKFSFDERIEDGLYAQRSLGLFRQIVEDPRGAMKELPAPPAHR